MTALSITDGGEDPCAGYPVLSLARDDFTRADTALGKEWLVTNGIGGFASGTVGMANTRRYHGLLMASLRAPLERVLMVSKVDVTLRAGGVATRLGCNEFADGTLAPRGYQHLAGFRLELGIPTWVYAVGGVVLEQQIWMAQGRNTTYLRLRVLVCPAEGGLELDLLPLCTYRDYHAQGSGGWPLGVSVEDSRLTITAFDGARPYALSVDRGHVVAGADWYWRFRHRAEAERGLDAAEDLFQPGSFVVRLRAGESVTLTASAESQEIESSDRAKHAEEARRRALLDVLPEDAPTWIRDLTLAADQFIVARGDPVLGGRTVIAGYPWFGDWGRDTMIALPGLTVTTRRYADAASILRTFAHHVSEGMLPNRFPDAGETPEYNTVDATLWYFHAIYVYINVTGDLALLAELFPILEDIVAWHERGTRYGIQVDRSDGLLRAGVPGVQLTWMDAKVGDWVVTPRIGKPVEVNALWHFALQAMGRWAGYLQRNPVAERYTAGALRVLTSFRAAFWSDATCHLHDVVDGPDGQPDAAGRRVDSTLRPNQLFAVSLGAGLLDEKQSRAVVDACARELLTPVGLRSLSPRDGQYAKAYMGGPGERDAVYHQGTVWGWLLGPYAKAHYRVYGDAAGAQAVLRGLVPHLGEACLGSISEIFDGDAPHAPRGCFAQAWSVAETLHAWHEIASAEADRRSGNRVQAGEK